MQNFSSAQIENLKSRRKKRVETKDKWSDAALQIGQTRETHNK